MSKLDKDWMTLPDGTRVPRPKEVITLPSEAQTDWLSQLMTGVVGCPDETRDEIARTAEAVIRKHMAEAEERGAIKFRDKLSTSGRPLSALPKIEKQPVPCPRCGAEEYADWSLYPHQLYNSYMPGGIGHYCFPCFAAIVVELQQRQPEGE